VGSVDPTREAANGGRTSAGFGTIGSSELAKKDHEGLKHSRYGI
jgi:hypothetical protein